MTDTQPAAQVVADAKDASLIISGDWPRLADKIDAGFDALESALEAAQREIAELRRNANAERLAWADAVRKQSRMSFATAFAQGSEVTVGADGAMTLAET